MPGHVSYGSDWETAYHTAIHQVYSPGTTKWLVDYSPTTTDGYSQSGVSASVSVSDVAAFSFTYSSTYTIPYVKVLDQSDYSVHKAQWQHVFNIWGDPVGAPSDSTFNVRPWHVVKTTQDAWTQVDASYNAEFGHWEYRFDQPFCWFGCWVDIRHDFAGPVNFADAQRSGDT